MASHGSGPVEANRAADAPEARAFEDKYRAAREALNAPPKSSQGLVLVISMVLFGLSVSGGSPVRQIVVTLVVLLFHELGHYVGMRAFGYRDVRMFFIPFFGAAVSGKPHGTKAWNDGVVSLLGPLPGIFLAFALAVVWRAPSAAERDIITTLLVINVLNLLPLGGFDGSRFLQRVLFSRHRYLEVAFLTLAGVALLLLAITRKMWVIAIFAYLGLVVVPLRHRVLRAAHGLKRRLVRVEDARKLDDELGYAVYLAAREVARPSHRGKPDVVSALMEQIVEATRPPPGALATMGLLAGWLSGFVVASAGFIALASTDAARHPAPSGPFAPGSLVDYPVPGGGFVVSMPPGGKATSARPSEPGVVSTDDLRVESGVFSYQIHVAIHAAPQADEEYALLVDANLARLAEGGDDTIEGSVQTTSHAGLNGRTVRVKQKDGSRCRFTYLFDGARDITLAVCSFAPDPPLDDLARSFRRSP